MYNNFKEVCVALGLMLEVDCTPKGNTRKRLEKELDCICKWHKEGRKIVVDEIYSKLKPKLDKRREKSVYVDSIKAILFYSLRECKEIII